MDKMRQWTLLTVVAVLAVLAGGYFLLVQPKSDKAAEVRASAEAQRADNARLEAEIARLTKQAQDLPRQQAKLAAFAARIPNNPALPSLIRTLTDAADRAGIELISMAPGPPVLVVAPAPVAPASPAVPAAGPAAPGGAVTAGTVGAEPLFTIPLTLAIKGGYVQVQQFFSNLEDLTRSLQVGSFSIAPVLAVPGVSTTSAGGVTVSLVGRVFMTAPAPGDVAPVTAAVNPAPVAPAATPSATPAP